MTRTILLVDDEPDVLLPMRLLLEDEYRVLTAPSGVRALEILDSESVDMIISDQRMPAMTGVALLTRVWELYPDIVRIILTGYMDTQAMIKSVNEGRVYQYIIKPWSVDHMHMVIRQGLAWKDLVAAKGRLNADLLEAHAALAERTRELERAQETIVRQEKLAAVGRFAAEMHHEMNNHLHVILGLNTIIAMSISEEDRPKLRDLERQIQSLIEIAGDIRDFAKGAVLDVSLKSSDPFEVAQEVIRVCKHHPDFQGVSLRLDKGQIDTWDIDNRQIKHLLMNLLKNAAKASAPADDIEVFVETTPRELIFRVTDHGVGIPPGELEQIWEPFFTRWQAGGTGLGLNICQRSVKMHGGKIDCQSTEGQGTTFIVRIPKQIDDGSAE